MKKFLKIIGWFWKNILKLLIISLVLISITGFVIILIPIFQFADFLGEVLNQMQGMIYDFNKKIDEFPGEKLYQDKEDEVA